MNILPKKNWHVLKRENILKVKADKKKAKDEEEFKLRNIEISDQKKYLSILRKNSENALVPRGSDPLHLTNIETNEEYEEEKRKKKEKEEKNIGLLTYLGQSMMNGGPDKDELWWTKPCSENEPINLLRETRKKQREETRRKKEDPMELIMECERKINKSTENNNKAESSSYKSNFHKSSFVEKKSKRKHKKKKSKKEKKSKKSKKREYSSSSSSSNSISDEDEYVKKKKRKMLEQERLEREYHEKRRTEQILKQSKGLLFPSGDLFR